MLFQELSVEDHLRLVCRIKGVQNIEEEINNICALVMLDRYRDYVPPNMSGGMKRKLSLGMALVGKAQVIILDEPTSGLDVESRRQVWDIIQKIKVSRSIILSTQHIEEADVLASRICIMSHGKIRVLDTPENIKKNFGVGYNLMIEPKYNSGITAEQLTGIRQNIRQVITGGQFLSENASESIDSLDKKMIF